MLLIDVGNSRVKWAWIESGAWSRQGAVENAQVEILRETFNDFAAPEKIIASNVAGEKMAQQLQAICDNWSGRIEFIAARNEQCGVRNLYQTPEQLGSDRWAALIAAWQLEHTSCLVVNCGTATTVDALSPHGEYLGGLILPGVGMMQKSLATGTVLLKAEEINGNWKKFPRTTSDAIVSGAIQATAGAIRLQYEALAEYGVPRCLVSGGAAASVLPHLDMPLSRVENLVLHGLQIIAQETNISQQTRARTL